jgi:hypothetical protein
LKSAIKNNSSLFFFDRFGEIYFSPSPPGERNDHLVEYPFEELESELVKVIHINGNIKQYLEIVTDLLRNTVVYRRFIRVIDLAVIIKKLSIKLDFTIISSSNVENEMLQNDIVKIVETCLLDLRKSFDCIYVKSNKMKTETMDRYMQAIHILNLTPNY